MENISFAVVQRYCFFLLLVGVAWGMEPPWFRSGDKPVWVITSLNYQEVPFVTPVAEWRGVFRYRHPDWKKNKVLWLYGDLVLGSVEVWIDGRLAWRREEKEGPLSLSLPQDSFDHLIAIHLRGEVGVGILGYFGVVEPVGKWVSEQVMKKTIQERIEPYFASLLHHPHLNSFSRIDGSDRLWHFWREEDRTIGLLGFLFLMALLGYRRNFKDISALGHVMASLLYGFLGYYIGVALVWWYGIYPKAWDWIAYWGGFVYFLRFLLAYVIFKDEQERRWLWRWSWRKELIYLIPALYLGYTLLYREPLWLKWFVGMVCLSYGLRLLSIYWDWREAGRVRKFRNLLYFCVSELGIAMFFYGL